MFFMAMIIWRVKTSIGQNLLTEGCPCYQLEVRKSFKFSLGQFFNIEVMQNPFSKEIRSACYWICAHCSKPGVLSCLFVKFSVYVFFNAVSPSICFFCYSPVKLFSCETGIAGSF